MNEELDSTSLVERIVLCCLTDVVESGQTPVDTARLRGVITDRLESADTDHVGRVAEADVMRALNRLTDCALVDEHSPDDRSPVGKGRPEYDLAVDPETVRETLKDDPRVRPMLE